MSQCFTVGYLGVRGEGAGMYTLVSDITWLARRVLVFQLLEGSEEWLANDQMTEWAMRETWGECAPRCIREETGGAKYAHPRFRSPLPDVTVPQIARLAWGLAARSPKIDVGMLSEAFCRVLRMSTEELNGRWGFIGLK